MSGEDLRTAAKLNDATTVRTLLRMKCNPCSVDEYGLSALHHAVWNGHVECVKLLCMNSRGVTKDRIKTSCVNLQTTLGFTAFHLAAKECPLPSLKAIIEVLLLSGIDPKQRDSHGRTALDHARKLDNGLFLDTYKAYSEAAKGNRSLEEYRMLLSKLQKDYVLHPPKQLEAENEDALTHQILETYRHTMELLHIAREEPNVGAKPEELKIHEHLIMPIANFGYYQPVGVDSLHILAFAAQQGTKNAERRLKLVEKGDSSEKGPVKFDPNFRF